MKETTDNMYILRKMHDIYLNKDGKINIDGIFYNRSDLLRQGFGSDYKDSLEEFIENLDESQYLAVIKTMEKQVGG